MSDADLARGDLELASACVNGDARAIEAFESRILSRIPAMIARQALAAPAVEEVQRSLRQQLLGGGLARYDGRGSLEGWVRVIAIRAALDARAPDSLRESLPPGLGDAHDPELAKMRERHRDHFDAAFREGFLALTAEERNLLRYYFADGVPIGRLAVMLDMPPTAIHRRLEAIQQKLFESVSAALRGRLGSTPECESLLRFLSNRLQATVETLLRD